MGALVPKCGGASVKYAKSLPLNDRTVHDVQGSCLAVARDSIAAVLYRAPHRVGCRPIDFTVTQANRAGRPERSQHRRVRRFSQTEPSRR